MNWGFYVFISLFYVLMVLHLYFCFVENEKARKASKPFLMLLFSLAMIVMVPKFPMVYISCLFCMIGDIFMLYKKKMLCFSLGAICFAIHHSLNFFQVKTFLSYEIKWYYYLSFTLLFIIMVISGYFMTGKKKYGMLAYGFAFFHVVMLVMSILVLIDGKVLYGSLMLTGYLSCIFSDLFLDYTTHKKDCKRRDFYIMLTYLAGECLLLSSISSMCFLLG